MQDALELHLFGVTAISRIGVGSNQLTILSDLCPELIVIKIATVGLTASVVNVLHVYENSDLFHITPLQAVA
jgi:hypothetical protein